MPTAVQEQPRPDTAAPADIDLNQELTCGFAHKFIRHKSRQLVGRCGIRRADRADLDQELKLLLMRRFGQFDPAKSDWPAFVTTVVERQVATILQSRRRLKRLGAGMEISLSEQTQDEEGHRIEEGDLVQLDHVAQITREFDRTEAEWFELDHDMQAALATLPIDLRELCIRLQSESIASVAKSLGLPRGNLLYVLKRLRATFEKLGLDEFHGRRAATVNECADADDELPADESEKLSE